MLLPELEASGGAGARTCAGLWRGVRCDDAAAARDIVSQGVARHSLRLVDPGAGFRFEYRAARISNTVLSDFEYRGTGSEVRLSDDDRGNYMLIVPISGHTDVSGAGFRWRLAPGNAMIFNPDQALAFDNSPGWRNLDIVIDRERFNDWALRESGADVRGRIGFARAPFDLRTEGRALLSYLRYLLAETRLPDSALASRLTAVRCEETLYALLLESVPSDHRPAPESAARLPAYVLRAERFIAANAAEPLDVARIAADCGVSIRTLHKAFRRHRGCTPLECLREQRLARARAALARADATVTTVTAVALACGFTHLGKFAAAYRRRYGESPRDTLRLRADDRRDPASASYT